jgi:hypothetical protein
MLTAKGVNDTAESDFIVKYLNEFESIFKKSLYYLLLLTRVQVTTVCTFYTNFSKLSAMISQEKLETIRDIDSEEEEEQLVQDMYNKIFVNCQ